MITKKALKTKPVCKVTFSLSRQEAGEAAQVALVGDFNQWNEHSHLLKKYKNGSHKITVDLPQGQNYQFRYLIDGEQWINDAAADQYVPSGVSTEENGVVAV